MMVDPLSSTVFTTLSEGASGVGGGVYGEGTGDIDMALNPGPGEADIKELRFF